jgi:flagellar protein FlgJ
MEEIRHTNSKTSSGVPSQRLQGASGDPIRKAAVEFEKMFISEMTKHMDTTPENGGTFGGGPGEAAFKSMLTDAYAEQISRRGGLGLADTIERSMRNKVEGK